jgi:hypothetical protein
VELYLHSLIYIFVVCCLIIVSSFSNEAWVKIDQKNTVQQGGGVGWADSSEGMWYTACNMNIFMVN